ncbi:MAG: nucleotide exchange factor GrpE [Bacteroidetes bacterium]|nr:nucleotide exchange factor GrpE [Bacteroidota bacterium]
MSDKENSGIPDDESREMTDTQAAELEAARTEIAQLKDQLLRKAAEFENFKRRTREEKDLLMKYGAEGVILDLLPVIDDFERSLSSGKEHPDFEATYKGVEIIYGKLVRILENRGLRPIDAVGKPFDVDYHDALLQIPSAEVEPGTVLDVAEKGYMLYEKVIRHAKVTVSRESDATSMETDR